MQPYCGEQEEQQLLQVAKCTTLPSSSPGKAWVNKNYLPGISWRTVSEPVYLHIFILFRHPTLAAAEPEQKLWFNIDNLRKVSLCKWKEGEVVREKNFNLVAVLLWPQYSKCGTFLFSRKGTHSNVLFFFLLETWLVDLLTYTGTAKPNKHFFLHDECSAFWPIQVLQSQTNTLGRESFVFFYKEPSIEKPIVNFTT